MLRDKSVSDTPPLDPHKTILVLRHKGREVGRIPATADNANDYLAEMAVTYKELTVDYEPTGFGGLLVMLHSRR